jgi:hypothetical protein
MPAAVSAFSEPVKKVLRNILLTRTATCRTVSEAGEVVERGSEKRGAS